MCGNIHTVCRTITEEVYLPLWGHYSLYTKYDKTNFNYFK
jgi:hypothetical protein